MSGANLNITVIEKRMMSQTEASSYCGLAVRHFRAICPVTPVNLGGKSLRYDKRDLDQWIESEKSGTAEMAQAEILAKLG